MTLYKKNLFVGGTVLLSLILLGVMILRFSDAPFRLFSKPQIRVRFEGPTAEGLSEGSPIFYLGVGVGRVANMYREREKDGDSPRDVVIIEGLIDKDPPLPANLEGVIRSQVIGGSSAVLLTLIPEELAAIPPLRRPASRPAVTGRIKPSGVLDGSQVLAARYVGYDILPREIADLAEGLTRTNDELRAVVNQVRSSNLVPKLAETVDVFKTNIEKAGSVVSKLEGIIGDENIKKDIHEALVNFREASESATRIGKSLEKLSENANSKLDELGENGNRLISTTQTRVDDLSGKVAERLTQMAKILDNFESITRKLNDGKGAAGQLINNPALYENLLDTSKELKTTIKDFNRLVEQWEQEGISFKLKK